ncbi:hypothetical protein NLJ89_g6471 [Agrocybe chaxingu]|uniref:Uncharacterized protein n=1 Tax=Agrocybe chaxingu TaxID=84603 RepID=A0A9W8JWF1_9AGAR|nr:hypothetical protein NLJ89_g6471 [Agrocybe chaxingu]
MAKTHHFPWEMLKAESLRLLCAELVQAGAGHGVRHSLGRRDEMISFLQDINQRGLDSALKAIDFTSHRKIEEKEAIRTPSKRKSSRLEEDDDEGYNTRFKGVKRRPDNKDQDSGESASAPTRGRGRPRKSGGETKKGPKAAASTPKKKATGDEEPKRGRGRPRKSGPSESAGKSTAPESKSGRQVLVGVVLTKRTLTRVDADADAEGDDEAMEEDAVVAAVNGAMHGDLSSLGGSNKGNHFDLCAFYFAESGSENVPNSDEPVPGPSPVVTAGDHDGVGEIDADGDPDGEAASPTVVR